jgi:tetratricopeptide (TPR) repeat protein
MAYGNRFERERLPRAALAGPHLFVLLASAIVLAVAGACKGGDGFSRALATLDEALGAKDVRRLDDAFRRAYKRAASSADWLSILKRARAADAGGNDGHFLDAARRAISAMPSSEPVAAAAAYAMLRCGEPLAALALFRGALSAETRPALWAECFVAAARKGRLGGYCPGSADFARLAEILGDARPYAAAAALAVSAGDVTKASAWAERATEAGLELPVALLWDCGMYESLARRSDASASSADLAIMGDAAWLSGDPELALLRWEASIRANPRASWKPYVKLALISGDDARAESYRGRMRAAFLEGSRASPEAAVALASVLAAKGRDAEALAILSPFSSNTAAAALSLRISGASRPEGRLAADAFRFAESGSGEASGYALAILAAHGRVDDMLALYDVAEQKKLTYPDRWFYAAAAATARGNYSAAAAAIEEAGSDARLPEASLALGIVYRAMGDRGKAASELRYAASASGDPALRCAAFKELGGALGDAGDSQGAAVAYREAAAAAPRDTEASMLALGRAGP